MLEPESRVVLLDQLRPPAGYRLAGAVATSFTLSLTTALIPPLAFATFGARDTSDPLTMLESVRSCADRVDIFCQAGQIATPTQASDLMAFLEPIVHPVTAPRRGFLFHPKVWFLHFEPASGDGEDRVRLLCGSRNLVDSDAWDATVCLDGAVGPRDERTNGPLRHLLRQLPGMCVTPLARARVERVERLAELALRARWESPTDVQGIALHAWGLPRITPRADFSGYRHLVVSPFLDANGLAGLTARSPEAYVVSRHEALAAQPPGLLPEPGPQSAPRVLVMNPLAGLGGEEDPGDDTRAGELNGLHAKITVCERNRGEAHVFIGSPNATTAAYGGNVEFAVELIGRAVRLGVGPLMAPDAGFRGLLEPYVEAAQAAEPDQDQADLVRALRNAAAVPMAATVDGDGAGAYVVRLSSAGRFPLPPGYVADARLLTVPGRVETVVGGAPVACEFRPVALADLTPFVVLRLNGPGGLTASTVVHAPLLNDPPGRLDEVLARQVDTPEKFLRLLQLMLSLGDGVSPWQLADGAAEPAGNGEFRMSGPGVLESIAAALYDQPENLRRFDGVVANLSRTDQGQQKIPVGFLELWGSVREALDGIGEAAR